MANIINDSQIVTLLDANVIEDTVSDAVNRALYNKHAVQFTTAGVGTLLVEGSLDGSTFVTIEATMAINSILQIVGHYNWIRVTRDNTTDEVSVVIASYSEDFG